MTHKSLPDIAVTTIRMKTPNAGLPRQAVEDIALHQQLIALEGWLRKSAYKNTVITTGPAFFDDSDMTSDYSLVVVYEKNSLTPLLSSRYFSDKIRIAQCLKGEDIPQLTTFNLNDYKDGEIFLADRLSGNMSSAIYRLYREQIFSVFYAEIVRENKNKHLLLMARKESGDKLLKKYLDLGFEWIGSTTHKSKEHGIVIADLRKAGHYVDTTESFF